MRLPETLRELCSDAIFRLGEDMAAFVTDSYRNKYLQLDLRPTCVVCLEMEKYLKPLILYKKKRYVGVAYEGVG